MKIGRLTSPLDVALISILIIISIFLFFHSRIDYSAQRSRTEKVLMLQQEITNLIRTTLLIKSGELAHFDYLVESERKIEDMMANLDARASKDFVSAVNQILETVLQTKSTFAVHLNSLLFFPKGAELLRSNLSATEWQPVVLKLNSLERSVMQFNIAASNKKTKEELKFQLESLRLFIKELPPQLFTSVSQLIRHGEVLIDYSEKLHSLNKQLLSNSVAISSQKLIDLYHISSQLEVQYSNKIRSGFYFTLFLLSLYILFLWWRQKKIMVSELKKSTEKIILASRVFSDTHEGIAITDPDGTIIDINPTFCEITGYSREEIIGQNSKILRSGKQSPEYYEGVRATLLDEGHWQGEVWNCKKGGELYAENLTISALKDDGGKLLNYVRLFSDITKSKQQQEQLNLMAHYDLLTKLPNRALYQDRFSQAIAHSKRTDTQLAIGFLDLDNFKPVNDTFGHHLGDLLLVEVAERITANIRATDTVSRQGGDEFALLLGNIRTLAQCENMLKRIHESLANPYVINGHTINISASSGITLYSPDSADNSDLDTLIRHADHAMYQAKTQGRNRFHIFNTEEDQQLMTNDFRKEVQG